MIVGKKDDKDIKITEAKNVCCHLSSKRIPEIDIIKGLGIIMVCLGHSGFSGSSFIYLFHMAIFFMASGYLYKEGCTDSIESLFGEIKKKIKHLWFPFFFSNAIFTILHNAFIVMDFYTDNPSVLEYLSGPRIHTTEVYSISDIIKWILEGILFRTNEQLLGAIWFLKFLFVISVEYMIIDFLCKKMSLLINQIQLVISVVLLLIGYIMSLKDVDIGGLPQIASCYCLFYLGHMISVCGKYYQELNKKNFFICFIVAMIILCVLNQLGEISLAANSYVNPLFLLIASLSGWVLVYSFACYIKGTLLCNLIVGIGKRTMSIMILHFLAFKIVAVIVCRYYELPMFCASAFPNLYGNKGLWWMAYTAVGVIIPIMVNMIFRMMCCRTKTIISSGGKRRNE